MGNHGIRVTPEGKKVPMCNSRFGTMNPGGVSCRACMLVVNPYPVPAKGQRVSLVVDVWHGCWRKAETEMTFSHVAPGTSGESESYWLADDTGQPVNVWPWEIEPA